MADPDAIYELAQRIESNIDVDKRVAALHALQSQLESAGYVVEADAVTSAVKVALKHANQALSTASLSFLPTYASMVYSGDGSESHSVLNHNVRMLVNSVGLLVIEKLGDQKERIREAARTALIELGNAAYAISSGHLMTSGKGKETETPLGIFERTLREAGLAAKFARVREQSVLLLPILRQNCEKYPVRPLLPITVDLLSDADATVREGARATLISLFSNATPAAKADLKKELEKKAVRKQTADAVLREVLAAPSAAIATPTAPSPIPTNAFAPTRTHSATAREADTPSSHSKPAPPTAASSAAATAAADDIRPVYIASRSDLERTFATMMPFFESKESEHNWLNREQSMIKLRGLIVSGAHRQFDEMFFVSLVKTAQDGILKCVASLRTTLSMHAIHLVQELAIELGDDLAPCIEPFLIHLTGMAGFTKKLIANATQEAAAAIMVNVSFRPLFLQLIWQGIQDKNVATRTAAADHLCTVLNHHAAHRKHAIESHGGLDLLDKCLRKGVGDSNPAARTKAREAFWIFHRYWSDHANAMLNSLDASTRKQVAAMAPAEVEAEVIVEKPKSSAPARVRPGGASMALMQAKKAAAIKAAQERQEEERRKAEEAAAAHEARVAAARQALTEHQTQLQTQAQASADDYATPVAGHRVKSTGFMPTRNLRNLKPSNELSVLVSPTAHQRIETAVAVPLPISPTPVGSSTTPQPSRTSSSTSGTASPALSPMAARSRAVSSSSLSSHGSGSGSTSSARMQASTPRMHRTARRDLDADLHDLSIVDVSDEGDATTQPGNAQRVEDDTLQLAAPEDASMDLMGVSLSSPFKLPATSDRAAKTQSVMLESTPRASRTVSASTNTPSSTGTTRRSGLPRPVSMMYSPSPIAAPTSLSSSSSTSLPKSASTRVLSGQLSGAKASNALEKRAQRLEGTHLSPSPAKGRPEVWTWIQALQNGTADVKVLRRLARLSTEFKVCATEGRGEDGREGRRGVGVGNGTVLTPGPLSDALNRRRDAAGEDGCDGMFKSATQAWSDGGLFVALFEGLKEYLVPNGGGVDVDVDVGVGVSADLELAAQVVLHRLLENQFVLFRSTDTERGVVELLVSNIGTVKANSTGAGAGTLVSSSSSSSRVVARKAAMQGYESLLTTWAMQCDPILGFDTLVSLSSIPSAKPTSTSTVSSSVALLRSAFTPLLLRLPGELLLEDHLPRIAKLVTDALNHRSTEVRLAATTMLKKLNDKLEREASADTNANANANANARASNQSHVDLFAALGLDAQKDRALLDVLMYYFSKR